MGGVMWEIVIARMIMIYIYIYIQVCMGMGGFVLVWLEERKEKGVGGFDLCCGVVW